MDDPVEECPEEDYRRIEVVISGVEEDAETLFECGGVVDRKMAHRFLESVGYAFIPPEPMPRFFPSRPLPSPRVSCKYRSQDCTDTLEKCSECDNNKAKSYFKPKEE